MLQQTTCHSYAIPLDHKMCEKNEKHPNNIRVNDIFFKCQVL